MENKFDFTPSKKALIVIMNVPGSISHLCKRISLSYKVKRADLYYEYSSFFKLTKQNIFAFTQTKNALIVIMIMNIPRSISLPRKTISLSQKVETPNSL